MSLLIDLELDFHFGLAGVQKFLHAFKDMGVLGGWSGTQLDLQPPHNQPFWLGLNDRLPQIDKHPRYGIGPDKPCKFRINHPQYPIGSVEFEKCVELDLLHPSRVELGEKVLEKLKNRFQDRSWLENPSG